MERKVGQKLMRKQMGKGSVFKRNAPGRDGLRPGVAPALSRDARRLKQRTGANNLLPSVGVN